MPSNGCGPEWMPQWIKDALFNWFFEASCNKHDEGYAEGGDERRRAECDRKFLDAMLRDVARLHHPRRAVAWVTAHVFYAAVRVFGASRFNYW